MKRLGTPASALLAGGLNRAMFASSPPVPAAATPIDTRPRVKYILPDGKLVAVIFDHGDHPPANISYQLASGESVRAVRA